MNASSSNQHVPVEQLARPPVSEAVIEVRGRVDIAQWTEERVVKAIRELVPGYEKQTAIFQMAMQFFFKLGGPASQPSVPNASTGNAEQKRWEGVRVVHANDLQLADFHKDKFYFSRRAPYPGWDTFLSDAMSLWQVHKQVGGMEEVQRLGVRFINRVEIPASVGTVQLTEYFAGIGEPPVDLPTSEFLYRTGYVVPNEPYGATLSRTIRPPEPTSTGVAVVLLVDIDVSCGEPFKAESDIILQHLARLRGLKNELFSGSLTSKALELCR